jgi:hypothetical protein
LAAAIEMERLAKDQHEHTHVDEAHKQKHTDLENCPQPEAKIGANPVNHGSCK